MTALPKTQTTDSKVRINKLTGTSRNGWKIEINCVRLIKRIFNKKVKFKNVRFYYRRIPTGIIIHFLKKEEKK